MMTLAAQTKAINCRVLKATDRTDSGEWLFICKMTGKPTDFAHCGLCQKKKPMKKVDYD